MEIFISLFLIWALVSSLMLLIVKRFVYKRPLKASLLLVGLFLTAILLTLHGELWGGVLIPLNVVLWWSVGFFKQRKLRRSIERLNTVIIKLHQIKKTSSVATEFEALKASLEHLGNPRELGRLREEDVTWYEQRFTGLLKTLLPQ